MKTVFVSTFATATASSLITLLPADVCYLNSTRSIAEENLKSSPLESLETFLENMNFVENILGESFMDDYASLKSFFESSMGMEMFNEVLMAIDLESLANFFENDENMEMVENMLAEILVDIDAEALKSFLESNVGMEMVENIVAQALAAEPLENLFELENFFEMEMSETLLESGSSLDMVLTNNASMENILDNMVENLDGDSAYLDTFFSNSVTTEIVENIFTKTLTKDQSDSLETFFESDDGIEMLESMLALGDVDSESLQLFLENSENMDMVENMLGAVLLNVDSEALDIFFKSHAGMEMLDNMLSQTEEGLLEMEMGETVWVDALMEIASESLDIVLKNNATMKILDNIFEKKLGEACTNIDFEALGTFFKSSASTMLDNILDPLVESIVG